MTDVTFDELPEASVNTQVTKVRDVAYDLLLRTGNIEREIADRVIKLIGPKYDPPDSVA